MKQSLAITIIIAIIAGIFPALGVSAASVVSGDFEYVVFEDSSLWGCTHIVAYHGTAENVIIPSKIDGYTVTGIGHPNYSNKSIFEKNEIIKSVTVSDGITHIWNGALGDCKTLISINLPDSITHIGVAAFQNCPELKSIIIPRSVAELGKTHFPENDSYYSYNNNLFAGCTNLTEIIVDEDNANYSSDDQGILYNKDKTKLIVCPIGKSGTVKIPDGITEISDEAFRDCMNLLEVTLPDGVQSIGRSAFEKCTNLTEMTIPDGVESIGIDAFRGCAGLAKITIPGSVKVIDSSAFENLENLKSVTMEYGVEDIGHEAFEGCTNLMSINIPDSVKSIGNYAFKDCVSLTELIIPDSVTSIAPMCVFENCTSLSRVRMSDNIAELGFRWFYGCINLKSINIPKIATEIGQFTFYDCSSLASVEIPIGVTRILDYAFKGCTSLTEIDIPNSVKQISCYAFMECTNLESVRLSNCISTIDHHTFSGCKHLTSVDIPVSVTEMKYAAFENCTNLTSVTLNNSNTVIEENGYIIPALDINPRDGGHPEIVCPPTFDGCDNLSIIYGFSGSTAQAFAYNQRINFMPIVKVQLNEVDLTFDVPPQLISDRTMVPMHKIFEVLSADIEWNDEIQTVTATNGEIVVIMQIGNPIITVSGKSITLDVPPQLVHDRTLVPVRAVAEGLAANVEWDGENQTVIITKEGLTAPVSDEYGL